MPNHSQYQLVADTIRWVADHQNEQPDLEQLSAAVGISPYHLQRTFQNFAGVSPKQFLKSLTRQSAVSRLVGGDAILDTALEAGLSGPGRLHDLMISTEAMTPGEVRRQGAGVELQWGTAPTPFGEALVAWTNRGINFLGFCSEVGEAATIDSLSSQWKNAVLVEDSAGAESWLGRIFARSPSAPLPLWLRGSPFQLKVWEALLRIPEGRHTTYGRLAASIGKPGAARAVGSAIGSNPVSWLIPCHRVIRQVGELGGYRWGGLVKSAMIGYEAAAAG